jgi:formylglycine-generating enzyme required for sulfatase activity
MTALMVFSMIFIGPFAIAQGANSANRFALVIGNSNYSELGSLKNPKNDATDIAASLRNLGFDVTLKIDTDLVSMEDEVENLRRKLSQKSESIGFFYYAGHGIQSQGDNYLIPVDARIVNENYLRLRAFSLQGLLMNLNDAKNALNIVVLDACRDNPYSWARSGQRGLTVVGNQPGGSIIVYATSAGSVAKDGEGKNGVFTSELLKYINQPGLEISDVFKRTGAGVKDATRGDQIPEIYSKFFGTQYLLGERSPTVFTSPQTPSSPSLSTLIGSITVRTETAGSLYLDGKMISTLREGGARRITDLEVGYYTVEIRYDTGKTEQQRIKIEEGKEAIVSFSGDVPAPPAAPLISKGLVEMVFVQGGTFAMGSNSASSDEKPVHQVTVSSFMIGKYEVTQEQYQRVVGTNPSYFTSGYDTGKRPVEQVTWYDAAAFCNRLSEMEGLEKVYVISGTNVNADFKKNGYRLPTEAEWEYAALGGEKRKNFTYAGSNDIDQVGWHSSNSGKQTRMAGTKILNEIGIYDMSGNVWEWCWDCYGSYGSGQQIDPLGASSGGIRVIRGGSWCDGAGRLRSTSRGYNVPSSRYYFVGFRVARRP